MKRTAQFIAKETALNNKLLYLRQPTYGRQISVTVPGTETKRHNQIFLLHSRVPFLPL